MKQENRHQPDKVEAAKIIGRQPVERSGKEAEQKIKCAFHREVFCCL
jgi:hypothetical protein